MTRSEMAFVFGLLLWYLCLADGAPTLFAWWGGALVLVGYFTAPRVRLTINADLPRPGAPLSTEQVRAAFYKANLPGGGGGAGQPVGPSGGSDEQPVGPREGGGRGGPR